MRNLFKLGFLAFALTITAAACNSENKADSVDSTAVDTASLMTDTAMTDTMAIDTATVDTTAVH
jgi:hypothetical protein